MANDKQYRVTVGGESQLWDADKYERNKDKLTSSYPDAKVEEVGYMSANEEQVIPGEKYRVIIGDEQQEWDSDKLNRNKGHLLQQYPDAKIERLGVIGSQNQPEQNDNIETNFFKGLHQMNKNIWQAGLWHSLGGEIANLFTGSSREEQAALNDIEYLESVGIDPREYLANVEEAEFQKLFGMNREQFDALDKSERKRLTMDAASMQSVLSEDAAKALAKERKQRQSVIDAYQDALAEAGGDLDKAKEILKAKAEDKTWGDKQIEKANAIYAENKELQGAAKWGGLAASAIPSAAALGLSFLTKGKSKGISKWLNNAAKLAGNVGMAGMSAGTAGLSMIEARQHGATNWETWTTGIADGLIEFITEKIPFDKLTKPVLTAAKTRTTKALMDAMRRVDSPGRKELEKLLTEANKKLGGKLLNGKNVADWLANAATEAVSEATAEALQTVTSMIYLNPEEYPTFSEIALNAWEGAKGGFALGGVLGGAGKAVEHSLNKDRRKQQGFVNVALVEQEGKNPFVAELVDYDPETKTYKALQDGEIVDVNEDEIQYKHQYTYNEFESGRYRQLEDEAIADGTVSDAQVAVSADRLGNARQKLENLMTEAGMTDEQKNATFADLEAGDIPGFAEDAKALWDAADEYSEAFKRDKDIQSARNVKAENERKAVLDAMTQQMGGEFWQKGSTTMQENGMEIIEPDMVETGTMQDGKQVFILSTPNENGEVSAITEDGKKMFIRNTDLQGGTTIMPLQEYLDARVSEQKKAAEQARMAEEAAPQLDVIRQKYQIGARVNLGTEDSPTLGQVIGIKPENDGVFIQTEAGVVPYTYEQLADIEGTPIRVMTDAQMAAAEAAEIEAAESARMSELAETPEQMTEAETVVDNAVQMENLATETPLPLNPDGSVNQDALFKESPARWAEWNDERKQDGGASSAQYISGKLAKAQARLAELQTAYAVEDSLNKKELLEKAVAEQQGIVDELAEIMQNYAPAETAPVQTGSVQPAPAATQQERTTESVLASLNDGTLTDEEIRANIEANLAEAQKAYDKYVKKAPKMGTDKDAYLAEKQKYEQGLPALQQEIDFWNGVKQTYEGAMQQDVLPTEESFRAQLTQDDMEPRTPAELAASELGIKEKGIKLLKDSFKAHTGYGSKEASRFFGLFRTKEKGGMTIEAAGDRLMEIDAEYGLGILDQNDPMAGVNAILDLLGDVQTMGDISNYIARNREAQAAKEAAAAYSAMNADFEAAHGMTMEEWAHANEVQRIEIMSKSALTDAEEYERNVKFAEEENQYGTNEQSTGTEGVSGGEDQRDAGNVEGGFDSLHRQGDSILQEAQSDNTGGETISDGQTSQDVSEGNDQDGDTSVYGSEQAAEVDDLPPAYSGVKRAKEDAEHVVNPLAMTVETHLKIMEETREAIHERVNTWSNKLGIKINIIDNYRDVKNKDAKENIAKGNETFGWFEKSTGEIFIYVPDYLNYSTETALKEVEKTILHEGIAHKGMREMLGEEKYGELCDKVWNEMMTDKQRKEFIKYPGVNGDTRAAADEFIASVSENVKQDTVWDKIANFFKDILNSIGIEIKVADNDLKGLLKQSYRRFRKGGAKTNPGSNRQAEGNTSLRSANGSLVGMHNISEDKLRKVLKQGGLANPSTAVVNIAEYLLDGYGDISLIMPSSLVDANTGDNIGTYTGDAWTPTYPPISRKVDDKGWKVIKDLIRSVVSEDSPLYHDIINGLENYLEDNRSSKMEFVFLKEKGIEPEITYKGADGFVGMRNLEAILGVQGLRDGLESYERYKNASPMAKRSFNMWLDAAGNKQAHKELKELIKKEPKLAEVLKLNEDVSFAEFDSFTYDIFRKEQDAGKIDTYDTMGAAARYVDANNLRGEFEAWLESLIEQAGAKEVFFAGYTRDGDRIYKDNTLENVSRHMRLQGRTNAYDDHGLSATKSALLQRLTSLSQIRKNKARLQNESAYNKEYDALKDRLWSIISQLADMQEISSNQFMNVDYAESRLQESFTKKNPIAHLNKEYGYDIDPAGEYAEELNSFIKDVQQMPAKYFETKFERPVYLNEFAAAVMPTTTSEDIKQAVSEAGLPIFEYDSEVEGSRKEATLKATEGEGIRFRTLGEKGAANLDKAEEATIRLDNLGVARQMEEAGKDAKAIKLATGWERGADNLWRYEVADDFDLTELENRLQENLNDGLSKTWGVLYPSDLGDLTKSYPDFNVDIMVWVGDEFENTGEYSPATEGDETTFGRPASIEVKAKTVADIKDVLVHEIQHAIQEKEGFAEGGSVFGLKDKLSAELDKRVARIKELRAEGRDAEADELMRMSKGLAEAVINNDADTYQNYRKLAGEVEARNISARLGMSEQERRESLLSETEDVAREDQIVLMDGLGVSEMGTNMLRTRITPEQDAAYLKAVEAGDMEAAQRMVNEAAKLAMPNTKVVDEEGNPKVVYHGTGSEFYTFRKTNDINELGTGYYFSDSYEMAERYATDETLADNRLRAENLAFEIFTEEMGHSEEEYDYVNEETEDDYNEAYYQAVKRLFGNGHVKSVFLNIENPFIVGSRSDDLPYRSLWQQTDEAHRVNDGIIDPEFTLRHETLSGNQYVAFKPSQIKSADPVTYDDAGNVIPLSERFNEDKNDIRFRTSNNNQAIFVSNAAKAVEGIKQEKATPEQWLKMIEKNGGLKAGEDKWMGLSDFLKSSDKKTLTKQDVLDFVNEHMIQIEEVHYDAYAEERASDAHSNIVGVLQNKFNDYVAEYHEEHGYEDEYDDPASKYAIEKLREEMEDTFPYTIELVYGNEVYVTFDYEEEDEMVKWAEKTGVNYIPGENPINSTRLDYTTDGLKNKHEIALTVPNIESWHESDDIHFGDAGEGRAVAWIRFGETKKLLGTTEVDGKKKFNWAKVLVIDEIQSKRHQEGREKGYATMSAAEFSAQMNDKYGTQYFGWQDKASPEEWEKYRSLSNAIPDAPFEKNWHELAMKRMLRYAAENGYDVVAWTKGDQQAERYNIGGVISEIKATKYPRGYEVVSFGKNGSVVHNEVFADESAMAGVYGKEMAQRIIESVDALEPSETATISGDNLRVGGEGMKGFYDKMLPAFMNKYGKKWGVKVEDIHLNLEGGLDMHSVPVTEEMKESVMEGQTMFKTKHPQEFAKQFMQDTTNEFYETYNTFAPASVVYANSRKMIEDALGFDSGKMPDWVYDEVKKEAKTSPAYLVTIEDKKEDGSVETRRRILIFANDSVDMSSIVDWMLFHENTHAILQDVGDKDSMLKLGEWLLESDNKHVRKIADWVKATYEEDAWAEEMLCEYVGKMLAIGRGQWALNLVPEEYKPILNEIYGKFGYRPEQEDGRRDGEISRDIRELQMRNSELEGTDSNKTLFRTGISPEVRKEMDVISAQAIVNGNYMKAPNGKDSKLTPEQWAMVRTKNFKRWFGDWENDPANASKVVDENGEPKVVYHQTNSVVYINKETGENWDELDWRSRQEWDERDDWDKYWEEQDFNTFSRVNARTTNELDGFFFAPVYDENHEYGDRTIPAFLNIKNPASREDYNIDSSRNNAGRDERIRLQNEGFDGVIREESGEIWEYVAFNPNQIKSATDNTGEFSESEDIRFKTDTQGRSLSREQQEFFANSKAVDKDGNLLVLYHGTPRAGFTEFKSGWFTTSKEDAISYSGDRKGRLFDPNEKYEPETLTAGDFRLGYMTFDSEEDRAAFIAEHPTAESAMSESEFENARIQAEDEEYDTLTERKPELQKIWDAYREYERDHFVDTTIGEILNNPDAYTEDDLRRAVLAYDSNAVFDSIDELETTEERKSALVDSLNYMNEDAKENGAEGILDMVVATRVPRNGEGVKHNDLGNRTYEVYARIERPYEIDANGRGSEFESGDIYQSVKDALADEQYDGVIIRNWRVGRHQQLGDVVVPKYGGNQVKLTSNENPTEGGNIMFKTRTAPAPTKTQDVYKLMRLGADGKLYPLFIGSAEPIELGTWYDAESPNLGDLTKLASGVHLVNNETGEAMTLEEFKAQHPEITIKGKRPNVAAINWATENGARWIEIEDKATAQRRYEGESRSYYNLGINGSGQVGQFAMRPGWHAGSLPTMRQIGKGKDKNLRDDSFVWVKGRIPADVDYQSEADANPDKDIPTHIPTDGFYMKATNANAKASQADKMGWYVAGSFIADEIISDAEARSVIDSWNAEHPEAQVEYDYERESGREYDPKRGGLVEKEGATLFKTTGTPTEQVVKDGLVLSIEDFTNLAGNIFSAMPEDIRRKVVENAARTDYDLKKATLQMSASLAKKAELTDEEIELAKMVAQKVEDAVLASGVEMTRPFTTNEALWMLYQSTNPLNESDPFSMAERFVVAHNLGFTESQQEEQEKDADNIRFRSARGAASNSAATMYNNEQRSAWGMLRETYQDMYRSVKNLVQAIEKATGKEAQSWENILTSLNALSSKNLADKKKYLRDFLTPMWDAALAIRDKYHKSLEQIERYLMVKHGLERNKVLAARDARNFYREQADQEIAAIKADKSLSKAEQKTRIQKVEDTYDNHVSDIEAGVDAKFQEFRAKDYGGLTALFSDFADYGTREDYESEELYQEAALAARTPTYATLAETELAAQQEVDAFEKEVDKALVDNLWKKINAATKETLRHQYANNMLTKEQYERVRDMFEFYVPLRGFVDTTAEDTYSYYVSGQQSKFANPLQGAKGRKTQAETPLGWIGSMAESAIQMDNKNTAKLALYYFAVNRPNNDVLKITPTWYEWTGEVDADGKKIFEPVYPTFNGPQSGPAMQAQMDAFESMMEQQAQAGNAYKGKQRIDLKEAVIRAPKSAPEHVVTVKVAGEDYSIIINANPRAAQAINGMLNVETRKDWFHRATTGLLRYLAAISTSYSPLFWITNFMRDISFAFINTSIRNDAGYTKEFAKNYPKAFRVFLYVHKNRKAALGDSKYEKYYTEFAENGGITGYTSLTNNTEYDQIMKAYANDARLGKFIKGIKSAFQVFQNVGESFEQVSRFAAYITARESGKDISESIYEAKEVTINFNRKGSGRALTMEEAEKFRRKNGKKLTAPERIFFVTLAGMSPFAREFYMFFNAGMQGVRMIAKLVKEHPGKFAAWHGIVFTMGLINAIIHALAEDDDEYLDMPDYVRRTNILIGKNGTYFKWSLPHEFRPSYAMADILVQHAMGRKPNENIVAELAETFGEWLPINPFKDGMNAFVPDFVKIVAEIKDNKDFTGSPIFREYRWLTEEQQKNMPAYEKGFDSTSKVLVDISEMLNDLSGGDQTKAGFININPAVVEHLAQKFGGGPLKLAEQFFKTIGVMTGDQEFSIRNTPFLSTFMVAADDRYRNAHTTELFKYYKGMADDVKRRAGEYKAEKDKEGFDKLRASDDFQIFQIYRKYEKRDKFYNEQLKRAKNDSERKDIMNLQDAHRKRMIEEISNL